MYSTSIIITNIPVFLTLNSDNQYPIVVFITTIVTYYHWSLLSSYYPVITWLLQVLPSGKLT